MDSNWYSRKNLQTWFVLVAVSVLAWFKAWPPEYVVMSYAMSLGIYGYFNVKQKTNGTS